MTRRTHLLTVALAALLACAPAASAQEAKQSLLPFGSLEAKDAAAAQTAALAWLRDAVKADAQAVAKANEIWKDDARSVLDRVTQTLTLGEPRAAALLEEARNPLTPAPTKVPELITDKSGADFFRANLAVAYARLLAHRRIYEEALAALDATRAEDVVDPAAYLFYRAVAEHGLLQKDEATRTIDRLIGDVVAAPERYENVGVLMLLDMQTWKGKDLGSIARSMKESERRLEIARGGPQTQKIQKDIVRRLDEIIKKLENQAKGGGGGGGGGGQPNGGSCPNGGSQPGNGGGDNPSAPMQDSNIATNGGDGTVDQAKLRKLTESWGKMPARERARALQELTRGLSASHREAIENYFRNLAQADRRR